MLLDLGNDPYRIAPLNNCSNPDSCMLPVHASHTPIFRVIELTQ